MHKAAAEKFKVPMEHSPLITETAPALTIKEESEEEEEVGGRLMLRLDWGMGGKWFGHCRQGWLRGGAGLGGGRLLIGLGFGVGDDSTVPAPAGG